MARRLAGALETDLMQGFCTECRREGLQLSRAMAFIDTLHPVHEGRAFRRRNDGHEESPFVEYGRTNEGEAAARWQRTPFYRLVTTGSAWVPKDELRQCEGWQVVAPAGFEPVVLALRGG